MDDDLYEWQAMQPRMMSSIKIGGDEYFGLFG